MNKETLEFNINMLEKLPDSLGTSDGPKPLMLDGVSDVQYLIRLGKIQRIRRKIDPEKVQNVTLPRLNKHLESLQSPDQTEPLKQEEDKKGSQRFEFPDNLKVNTRGRRVLDIIVEAQTVKEAIHRDKLIEILEISGTEEEASFKLSRALSEARNAIKSLPVQIKTVFLNSSNSRGVASYYLEVVTQEQDQAAQKTPDLSKDTSEIKRQVGLTEWPEFGPLSRLDVSIIAKNFKYNQEKINEYIHAKELVPLEDEVLKKLVGLTGNISVIPTSITDPQERSARILKMREEAKAKVKSLLLDPDFDSITEEIFEKDEDVWQLLVHLYKLNSSMSETSKTQGINNFFEKLVLNPIGRRVIQDVRTGGVMGVIYDDVEVTENRQLPQKPPIIITDETVIDQTAKIQIESATTEDEEEERQWQALMAEVAEEEARKKAEEETKISTQETDEIDSKTLPTPSRTELKEAEIEAEVGRYLTDVLSHPQLHKSVYRMGLKSIYPRLDPKYMEDIIRRRWVRVPYNREKGPLINTAAAVALLFLNDHSEDSLQPKVKKQIQKIAQAELEKRKNKNTKA